MAASIEIIKLIERALTSHAAAVDARTELLVARWGEQEREHARANAAKQSHGLLVNSIVHDPAADYGDAVPAGLKRAAKALQTAADREVLRRGG